VVAGLTVVSGIGHRGLFASLGADLEQVNFYRQALSDGAGRAINPDVEISNPSDTLGFLPSAATSFLLSPFPWEVRTMFQATGLLDASVIWTLIPWLYRGARHAARDVGRRLWPLLGLLLIMLSLLISDYGMILRQPPQVLIFAANSRSWMGDSPSFLRACRTGHEQVGKRNQLVETC
jgi:hypothetical protein